MCQKACMLPGKQLTLSGRAVDITCIGHGPAGLLQGVLQRGTCMIRIREIKIPLDYNEDTLRAAAAKRLGITPSDVLTFIIRKKSG